MTEPVPLDEIRRRHPDEWVCVEETEWDDAGLPLAGRVIAHGVDRDVTMRDGDDFRKSHPASILYSFYTGPLIPEGTAVIFAAS